MNTLTGVALRTRLLSNYRQSACAALATLMGVHYFDAWKVAEQNFCTIDLCADANMSPLEAARRVQAGAGVPTDKGTDSQPGMDHLMMMVGKMNKAVADKQTAEAAHALTARDLANERAVSGELRRDLDGTAKQLHEMTMQRDQLKAALRNIRAHVNLQLGCEE